MEWLFDRRGKSVANSAQKVVADMHQALDQQNKRVAQLEGKLEKYQKLCAQSLEADINRLEGRKKELISELEKTDVMIAERQEELLSLREALLSVNDSNEVAGFSTSTSSRDLVSVSSHDNLRLKYTTETNLFSSIKSEFPNSLFIVHRNNVEDIVIYQPINTTSSGVNFVSADKLVSFPASPQLIELSSLESLMAYGCKIVPNHERDFPTTHEIPVPKCVLDMYKHIDVAPLGYLVGAFEIPLTPGVVIDLWAAQVRAGPSRSNASSTLSSTTFSTEDHIFWVTTPIDGVAFAVLQRMFVVSAINWGVQSVVQVDLFGWHPHQGILLLESVTATGEQ